VTFFSVLRTEPKATRKLKEGVFLTPLTAAFSPITKPIGPTSPLAAVLLRLEYAKLKHFSNKKRHYLKFLHPQPCYLKAI